jgi:hypothetical protein
MSKKAQMEVWLSVSLQSQIPFSEAIGFPFELGRVQGERADPSRTQFYLAKSAILSTLIALAIGAGCLE